MFADVKAHVREALVRLESALRMPESEEPPRWQ